MLSQTLHHTSDNAQLQRNLKYFKQHCVRIIKCQTFKKTDTHLRKSIVQWGWRMTSNK